MGNGGFARYNGGKVIKMRNTATYLNKGFMHLICNDCGGPWSSVLDNCIRCSWKSQQDK